MCSDTLEDGQVGLADTNAEFEILELDYLSSLCSESTLHSLPVKPCLYVYEP